MTPDERGKWVTDNFETIALGTYSVGEMVRIGGSDRKCRFCGRTPPSVTFRTKAHAIPVFLGNKQLLLLEECDCCNEHFSNLLEDHLDKFTRPFRTMGQIRGRRGIPSYKSKDGKSRIDVNDIVHINASADANFCKLDPDQKTLTLNFRTEPFIPIAAYKALVKIAISTIQMERERELESFRGTVRWLLEKDHSRTCISPALLMRTFIPGPCPLPGTKIALFRRRPEVSSVPYALFVLGFGNLIFQIIVPSEVDARESPRGPQTYSIPFVPSPFDFMDWEYGPPVKGLIDLSSQVSDARDFPITMSYSHIVSEQGPSGDS